MVKRHERSLFPGGFALEALIRSLAPDETYFWATHTGAELDALFIRQGHRLGIEIKRADAPRLTPSMRHALHDLKLDAIWAIYPGPQPYVLDERIQAMPLRYVLAARQSQSAN